MSPETSGAFQFIYFVRLLFPHRDNDRISSWNALYLKVVRFDVRGRDPGVVSIFTMFCFFLFIGAAECLNR